MTDFLRLSLAIDSKSTKAATKDLEKLGAAGDVASGKIKRLAAAVGSLADSRGLKGMATGAAALSAVIDGLGMAMGAAGQASGYTRDQMAQLGALLVATGASAAGASRAITNLAATLNFGLVQSAGLKAVA